MLGLRRASSVATTAGRASRDPLIRAKRFQIDDARRRLAQIDTMIAEFERMSTELEREVKVEQDRAGIQDPSHFAYPTYAKAAIQRRENIVRSVEELKGQLEDAKSLLSEAFEELKKFGIEQTKRQVEDARCFFVGFLQHCLPAAKPPCRQYGLREDRLRRRQGQNQILYPRRHFPVLPAPRTSPISGACSTTCKRAVP